MIEAPDDSFLIGLYVLNEVEKTFESTRFGFTTFISNKNVESTGGSGAMIFLQ